MCGRRVFVQGRPVTRIEQDQESLCVDDHRGNPGKGFPFFIIQQLDDVILYQSKLLLGGGMKYEER